MHSVALRGSRWQIGVAVAKRPGLLRRDILHQGPLKVDIEKLAAVANGQDWLRGRERVLEDGFVRLVPIFI